MGESYVLAMMKYAVIELPCENLSVYPYNILYNIPVNGIVILSAFTPLSALVPSCHVPIYDEE